MPSSREITVCLDVKRNRKWKHQAISACGESEKTVVNLKISSTLYSYYLSFCTINCSLQLCLGSFNWKEKLPCPSAWQDCPKVPPFLLTFLRSGWQSLSNRALRYSSLSKPPKSDSEYWDSWICCIGHTYISSGLKILLGKHQTEQPGRAETAADPHQRFHEYGDGVCIPCRHTGMQTYMYLYRDASRSTLLKEPLHTHSQTLSCPLFGLSGWKSVQNIPTWIKCGSTSSWAQSLSLTCESQSPSCCWHLDIGGCSPNLAQTVTNTPHPPEDPDKSTSCSYAM